MVGDTAESSEGGEGSAGQEHGPGSQGLGLTYSVIHTQIPASFKR